jgi:hypothetical protein
VYVTPARERPRGAAADVVYVLCLMQAAFLLLAGLGEVLLMGGNPAYLLMPAMKMVLLFVLAAKVVSGRRWALITMIVVQAITILGFWLQIAVGLLPWVTFTVNLVGLITNLALPGVVVALCATTLASGARASGARESGARVSGARVSGEPGRPEVAK